MLQGGEVAPEIAARLHESVQGQSRGDEIRDDNVVPKIEAHAKAQVIKRAGKAQREHRSAGDSADPRIAFDALTNGPDFALWIAIVT
jgi:hypothetical protein